MRHAKDCVTDPQLREAVLAIRHVLRESRRNAVRERVRGKL